MTYPTPAPDNYDDNQKIKVSPVQIEAYATSLQATVDDLNTHMDTIGKTWKSLKLGWAGQTETEVDSFNSQWTSAMTQMFGDPDADPKTTPPEGQAALGKIRALVKAAASTYAHTEESLCENALKFGEGLTGSEKKYGEGNLPDGIPGADDFDPSKDTNTGPMPKDEKGGYGYRDYTDAPIKETNDTKK